MSPNREVGRKKEKRPGCDNVNMQTCQQNFPPSAARVTCITKNRKKKGFSDCAIDNRPPVRACERSPPGPPPITSQQCQTTTRRRQ
jgi:hypothetical protein